MDRPSEITWEVMVDWDATDWAVTPDFTQAIDDISADINFSGWQRGKNTEEGNAPAGTHEIKLTPGLHQKYSIYYVPSPLHNKIRPWLPIRIRAMHDGNTYNVFSGFISSIKVDPHPSKQMVYIYVTDGSDLMARQLITQDYDTRTQMSDGEAVERVLDSAGWDPLKRNIDIDGGGDLLQYPQTGEY